MSSNLTHTLDELEAKARAELLVLRDNSAKRIVHGTPVTPIRLLDSLAGGSFCVSFAYPDQIDKCVELVGRHELLLLDNGAFSIWQIKRNPDRSLPPRLRFESAAAYREAFWAWALPIQARCPQAVAVIPDVIAGSETENLDELRYTQGRDFAGDTAHTMAIWHMDESLEQLSRMTRAVNYLGIGSSGEHDVQRNKRAYLARLAEASQVIDHQEKHTGRRPWIHLMRGLGIFPRAVRFDSADSCNVAVNSHRHKAAHGENRVRFLARRTRDKVLDAVAQARVGARYPTSNSKGVLA